MEDIAFAVARKKAKEKLKPMREVILNSVVKNMEGQMNKKSFVEWFDPHNKKHIEAYQHLRNTGCWPLGFLPEKIYMEPHWQILIFAKLADAWTDYKLSLDY